MKSKIRLVAFVISPPLIALGLVATSTYGRILQEPRPLLEAPDTWVAFQADISITHPGGPESAGRFYRASSGSYRMDTGPTIDDVKVVFIASFSEGVNYSWNEDGGWSWEDARHRIQPIRVPEGLEGWTLHPGRVALRVGESGDMNAPTGGFEAYQVVRSDGVTSFQVPALNFYPIVLTRPDGRYQKYYNVDLVEPDSALFRPPPGAAVIPREPSKRPLDR